MRFNISFISYTAILLIILLLLFQCSEPHLYVKSNTSNQTLIFLSSENQEISYYQIQDLENKQHPQRTVYFSGYNQIVPSEIRITPKMQKQMKMHHAYFLSAVIDGYGDHASTTIRSLGFCQVGNKWLTPSALEDEGVFIERCHRYVDP
ncbi:hypothetical protein [Acinetobacter sp. MB5]|uniref:hypothetical protein n=1 Tax=Acinetobacter sp. MB5 TaxID=2069438 RepID=UPI000DCFE0C6|nr:hypothetical protein [Acinetobacter sp. MB5]